MKLTNLKYLLLLGLFLFAGTYTETNAQLKLRFATDVRYIAGGFINKRPQFKTLLAALNDVKALATSERPYTFWVMSDTINIADWDSVYQSGGLTMKDSIDVYYVAVGKIKWAGFGFGGSGGGGSGAITPPNNTTTHYSLWTWTGQSGISVWQTRLGLNADSIDLKLWELVVYTDSAYLYIENDTLKLRESTITELVIAAGTRPDTTIIAYKADDAVITGDWEIDGDMWYDAGSLRLSSANNNTGVSRVIWSATNVPYWSGAGAVGDSSQFVLYDIDTGLLNLDSLITWNNLNQAVKDTIQDLQALGGNEIFVLTNSSIDITVAGMAATDIVILTPMLADSSGTFDTDDLLYAIPYSGGFYVKRGAAGTSALEFNWTWIRRESP